MQALDRLPDRCRDREGADWLRHSGRHQGMHYTSRPVLGHILLLFLDLVPCNTSSRLPARRPMAPASEAPLRVSGRTEDLPPLLPAPRLPSNTGRQTTGPGHLVSGNVVSRLKDHLSGRGVTSARSRGLHEPRFACAPGGNFAAPASRAGGGYRRWWKEKAAAAGRARLPLSRTPRAVEVLSRRHV